MGGTLIEIGFCSAAGCMHRISRTLESVFDLASWIIWLLAPHRTEGCSIDAILGHPSAQPSIEHKWGDVPSAPMMRNLDESWWAKQAKACREVGCLVQASRSNIRCQKDILTFNYAEEGKGLPGGGKLEEIVWATFANAPNHLAAAAAAIRNGALLLSTSPVADAGEVIEAEEGEVVTRRHLARERNRAIVEKKKSEALSKPWQAGLRGVQL